MLKKKTWLFIPLLLLIIMTVSCSSGGGSALPQASIPAPADDCGDSGSSACVTISSPDSEGFVTISGAEGAVPESATVEIRTSGSTSLLKWLESLSPQAYASSCESDLPECSSSGSTEDCHTIANSDGSFVVRIQAEVDTTLSITYFDPDTCDKSEAYEESVTNDLVTLEMEGVALAYNGASSTGYVFGYASRGDSSTDEIKMATLSIGGGAVSVSSVANINLLDGNPISMDKLPNAEQFIFNTLEGVSMISTEDSSTLTKIRIASGLGDSANKNPDEFVVQKNFNYSTITDTTSGCSITSGTTDRIFMPATDDSLNTYSNAPYFVLDLKNSSVDEENYYYGNPVSYSSDALKTITGEDVTLKEVYQLYIAERGNKAFFIASFSDDNKYLIEMPTSVAYCTNTSISVAIAGELAVVLLPSELENPGPATFLGEFGLSSGSVSDGEQVLVIPDLGSGNLYVIDYATGTTNQIDVASDLSLSSFTSVLEVVPTRVSENISELQHVFIGDSNSLGIFGLEGESLDGLASETDLNIGINPNDIQFMTTLDLTNATLSNETLLSNFIDSSSVLVLSGGGGDDGFSFLRLIPLSDTE